MRPSRPQRIVSLDPLLTLGMLRELGVPCRRPLLGIQDQDIRGGWRSRTWSIWAILSSRIWSASPG